MTSQNLFTGDKATRRSPPAQSGEKKDLLTGEPILENIPSTPILPALSCSTPLQPTSAGISEGPSIGSFIDEIRRFEANRNMRVDELMDEDFETQIGFDDRYTLVPSGSDTSNEEDEVDKAAQTTITEFEDAITSQESPPGQKEKISETEKSQT